MEKLEKNCKISKNNSFSRKGYDRKGVKSTVAKNYKNRIIFIKNKPIPISSTDLKRRAKLNI